jgi:asparagine synthetase B (glutamine-hydrolysing)
VSGGLQAHPLLPSGVDRGRVLTVLTPEGQPPPTVVASSEHTVLFDGRLYDRAELDGAVPTARGDADLILRAFLREGPAAFAKLRGPFAVVVWDRASDSVVCAHDALGAFPLFYTQVGDELLVSPFPDLLLAQERVPKTLNALALAEWVLNSVADVADTFFASVRRLPPAHQLRFDRDVRLERYWHPEDDPPLIPAEAAEVHAVFDQLLVQAVERCLCLPRTSVFLSGGVDSGVVAAVAAEESRAGKAASPLALSAAFPDPASNEVETQRAVASALGLEHVLLPVEESGPEGLLLPILRSAGDSPLPSTTPWEAVYDRLAAVARERGCRSILTGDGGNELLEARWELAADLLQGGDLRGLQTLYRAGRSYYGASRRRMLWRLAWRSGARVVLRDWAAYLLRSAKPALISAWYQGRYSRAIPLSLVPDERLRGRVVNRMLELHPTPQLGRHYSELRRQLYDDPGTPLALETNFARGRHVGLQTLSPLLDVDLIRFLYHVPPGLLGFGGRAKGLAHASLERRIDARRLPRLRAASFEEFFRTVLLREGGRALATLGGAPILGGLGIVDEKGLHSAVKQGFPQANMGYSDVWVVLGLEAWLGART